MICKKNTGDGKASRAVLPIADLDLADNSDSVSHPSHYADGWSNGAEVIDLTEHLSFCAGNVVKYVCRAGRKDPDKYVEDLEKARWYLDREIARVGRH
jgi:hypothetical protein|nr:MAG TPA: nucelotide kinase [Caudoviricetes sp.]